MRVAAEDIYLKPGEWFFGAGRHCVHTLLGSCVAIVLWHPQRHLGAMTHCMLPRRPSPREQSPAEGRFADEVVQLLAREARKHGRQLSEFHARIYGGMAVRNEAEKRTLSAIGEANIQATRELLRLQHVPIMEQHVGGHLSYRISLDLNDGSVQLQQPVLPSSP